VVWGVWHDGADGDVWVGWNASYVPGPVGVWWSHALMGIRPSLLSREKLRQCCRCGAAGMRVSHVFHCLGCNHLYLGEWGSLCLGFLFWVKWLCADLSCFKTPHVTTGGETISHWCGDQAYSFSFNCDGDHSGSPTPQQKRKRQKKKWAKHEWQIICETPLDWVLEKKKIAQWQPLLGIQNMLVLGLLRQQGKTLLGM